MVEETMVKPGSVVVGNGPNNVIRKFDVMGVNHLKVISSVLQGQF